LAWPCRGSALAPTAPRHRPQKIYEIGRICCPCRSHPLQLNSAASAGVSIRTAPAASMAAITASTSTASGRGNVFIPTYGAADCERTQHRETSRLVPLRVRQASKQQPAESRAQPRDVCKLTPTARSSIRWVRRLSQRRWRRRLWLEPVAPQHLPSTDAPLLTWGRMSRCGSRHLSRKPHRPELAQLGLSDG
jgi:hypothetical protein